MRRKRQRAPQQPKPRIVHLSTTVQTVFGVLDAEGNAIPQQPVTVQVHKLTPEAFTEAHELIVGTRDGTPIEE